MYESGEGENEGEGCRLCLEGRGRTGEETVRWMGEGPFVGEEEEIEGCGFCSSVGGGGDSLDLVKSRFQQETGVACNFISSLFFFCFRVHSFCFLFSFCFSQKEWNFCFQPMSFLFVLS